jgi:predicted metal-dependent peptidase
MSDPKRATLDEHQLAAARLWAAHRFPYLASALFAAPAVAAHGIGTVAVDESWRLYIDPEVVAHWSVEEFGGVLVHHASHLLRDHAARAQTIGVGTEQASDWLAAADTEINDDLAQEHVQQPGEPVLPATLGCENGRLAEEYFTHVRRTGSDAGDDNCCGSGADGVPKPWERNGRPGVGLHARQLLRRQVATEVLAHCREAGTVPAGLVRWAEELLQPRVDWRRVLAAELRRGVADVAGSVDYSYRRPSRRAGAVGDVVLPSLRRPVPHVAVVCDTSGSMTEQLLAGVLAEVEGLLRTVGVRREAVRILACDAAAHTAQRVSSARQVQLVGGGGTNMGAGIDAAANLRPRPRVIVVLTDGYTPWPAGPPPGIRVVVGLLGPSAPAAPLWARSVRVDDEP